MEEEMLGSWLHLCLISCYCGLFIDAEEFI